MNCENGVQQFILVSWAGVDGVLGWEIVLVYDCPTWLDYLDYNFHLLSLFC